jgi:Glyoxalase/Bleomycin resistance protein/Dioxygenase superfamily
VSGAAGAGSLLGPPVQIAYAVPDVVAAAEHWSAVLGAGPFFVRAHIPVTSVIHRGVASRFDHSSAYGQWGTLMVELVQDHGTGPSVVRDLFPDGGGGLHHLGYFVPEPDRVIEALGRLGQPLVMSATTGTGSAFHFVDARATCGHFLELYPPSEHLVEFYAMVARAAARWDGRDPVRPM